LIRDKKEARELPTGLRIVDFGTPFLLAAVDLLRDAVRGVIGSCCSALCERWVFAIGVPGLEPGADFQHRLIKSWMRSISAGGNGSGF
jgi:hypothetical protein